MITISKTAWPHQTQGLAELADLIEQGYKRICITSPTGGGKSLMMQLRMDDSGLSTSIYTHRKLLLAQLSKSLEESGYDIGIRASGMKPALLRSTQVTMIQSEYNSVFKKKAHELHTCKEFFIDEAHNNVKMQAQAIMSGHLESGAVLIGMTATPIGIGGHYDKLIIAGTNKELRKCGAHVPAFHYGPDEPSVKLVGTVKIGEGECGIPTPHRMKFAKRVFGRIVANYKILNPAELPSLLFAPGVQESIFLCEELNNAGISAAHIDGTNVVLDGEVHTRSQEVVDEIAARSESGDIKVICNRFVLREGIDWPWIYHGIFATIFGSLTAYIQAGGRLLRAHKSLDHVVIQDHGGNHWRHGSLNTSRKWKLEDTDYVLCNERLDKIREGKEPEPITCPKCTLVRMTGPDCPRCGFRYDLKERPVLQVDGSLREMTNDIFRKRRHAKDTKFIRDQWRSRVCAVHNSKNPNVKRMTFKQLDANFARDNDWLYAPRGIPFMPKKTVDWYQKISEYPLEKLSQ